MTGGAIALAGLARVKNEADLIEAFVRHHVALLDHLVVVDNASSDGTRAILAALAGEDLPLTVLDDATFVYRQSEIMTFLARAAFARFRCERLFLLDADEFLIAPHGRALDRRGLDRALDLVPREAHAIVPWMTYVPTADDDARAEPLQRIVHQRAVESIQQRKVAVSAAFMRDPGAEIVQGNHRVDGRPPAGTSAALGGVALAHFPLRSAAQLASKALVGWNAYVAMGYDDRGLGYQWRYAYEAVVRGRGVTEEALYRLAAGYPDEPADPAGVPLVRAPLIQPEIRYARLRVNDSAVVLAGSLEQLARQFAASAHNAERIVPALVRMARRQNGFTETGAREAKSEG